MAATSAAHISSYSASAVAMAGAFWPKMFESTRDTNSLRLAATRALGTMASRTASNSDARALACTADCPAWAAAALSQPA